MDKNKDLFETWIQSQNEFFNTWIESQEKFMTNWTESIATVQDSVMESAQSSSMPGVDRYYPEYLNWLYSPDTMSEEYVKNQKILKATFQKQMEIFKELMQMSVKALAKNEK